MVAEHCESDWLSQQLTDDTEKVLNLDCRSPLEYRAGHIVNAIHISIPTLMLRRLKKGNLSVASVINCHESRERFNRHWKSKILVLYDDASQDLDDVTLTSSSSAAHVVCLLFKRLKEDGCQVRFLKGGFTTFSQSYPELCIATNGREPESTILGLTCLHLSSSSSSPSSSSSCVFDDRFNATDDETPPSPDGNSIFPVEVLPNLYLGNARNSADLDGLSRNGIKYILNVTPNVPNTFENTEQFHYLQIPINDHWSQNVTSYFPRAIAFIDEARRKKCGVLVHCLAGISRSVTITVAYLMYSLSLSLNDAYDHVKRCKPNISPNFNFMGQLMDYERALKLERDMNGGSGGMAGGIQDVCRGDCYIFSSDSSDDMGRRSHPGDCQTCIDYKTCFSSPASSLSSLSSTATTSSSSSSTFDYEVASVVKQSLGQ